MLFLVLFANTLQAQSLRIMPLGNSITQGNTENVSYRYSLWKRLVDADVDFEFVGSHTVNNGGTPNYAPHKGKTFSNRNEGHWGWRADQILNGNQDSNEKRQQGKLKDWLTGYSPDVVLMHLGSNDVMQEQPVSQTIKELEEVVKEIRKKNPNVVILMAQLIPAWREKVGQPTVDRLNAFNQEIPALAGRLNSTQSPVIVVDQHTGFDPVPGKDTYDGVHPNASGEAKMAQRWFDAILEGIIVPLPVELKSFTGMATPNGVRLSWSTASEQDNHYFEVQRSQDSYGFESIGRVEGAGTTSLVRNYTLEDKEAPAGTNYYRLRQVDFSGEESYSKVVAVSLNGGKEDMRLYPTRTQGDPVTLKMISLQPQEKFSVEIYTMEGKLVKAFEAEADRQGNYSRLIELTELKDASLYMVRATLSDRVYLRHLLVDL